MSRYQKERPPIIHPKKKVEISNKDKAKRLIITIILLIVGLLLIGIGLNNCLESSSGWNEINYSNTYNTNITLYYKLGDSGTSATAENKELSVLYTQYLTDSYLKYNSWIYSDEVSTNNMYYINKNFNQTITVDKTLYEAIDKVLNSNNKRLLYLAPIYALYNNLLTASNDYLAEDADPYLNSDQKQLYDEFMTYIQSDDHVKIELLNNYQVRLVVSDAYYSFCNDYFETPVFVDFCYLMNAFIVDEVADKLIEDGYNNGMIYSNDGYQRIFVEKYQVNLPIYDYVDNEAVFITKVGLKGNQAVVTFKNYPAEDDENYSYVYEDNTRRSNIIKDTNYSNTSWCDYFTLTSTESSCVDLALEMINLYLNESIKQATLNELKQNNIYYIYMYNSIIHYNNLDYVFNDDDSDYKYDTVLDN